MRVEIVVVNPGTGMRSGYPDSAWCPWCSLTDIGPSEVSVMLPWR
jgi:hypothetical protein